MAVRNRIAGLALVLLVFVTAATAGAAAGYTKQDETVRVASLSETLTASDGFTGDGFGGAVDVDGDVMVVGAFGAAYVFTLFDGQWLETAKLTVPTAPPGWGSGRSGGDSSQVQKVEGQEIRIDDLGNVFGGFGRSVAVDGDVIVVGAYEAAYVYTSVEGEWMEAAKLSGTDDLSGLGPEPDGSRTISMWTSSGFLDGGFGHSVAVDGDVVVVGANGVVGHSEFGTEFPRLGAEYPESAYVFTRSGGQWPLTAKLKLIDSEGNRSRSLVEDVAVRGDVIAVGSVAAAHVYELTSDGWVDSAMLTSSDDAFSAGFDGAVSATEDTIAVSSFRGVHVFERSSDGWEGELLRLASYPEDGTLGWDVAVDGGLAVAVPLDDELGPGTNPLLFEMFDRTSKGWQFIYLDVSDDPAWKPQSVALDGEVFAVGVHPSTHEREGDEVWNFRHLEPGAVHVYNVEVLFPTEDGEPAAATPAALATPAAAATPTVIAPPTTEAAASVLVDDDDSSDGGTNAVWAGVIIAQLALIVVVVAYFLIRRKPADDAGRYNT